MQADFILRCAKFNDTRGEMPGTFSGFKVDSSRGGERGKRLAIETIG